MVGLAPESLRRHNFQILGVTEDLMKALILGGTGMLGHQLVHVLQRQFDVWTTIRAAEVPEPIRRFLPTRKVIPHVHAENFDAVVAALAQVRPDMVINGIGIVKQQGQAKDPVASLTVNALFPHRLAKLCQAAGCRLIHISTDCVFSGRLGNYEESDSPDAEDLYGRTKLLGEVAGPGCLTLRTSIIGHEVNTKHGLLEWFLSQDGQSVKGFRRAVFSGLTTPVLAECIVNLIEHHPTLEGIWHMASEPITKYDLLQLIRETYDLAIAIEPDSEFVCDRSLNGARLREATGWTAPSWPTMIRDMCNDSIRKSELVRRAS
jgi:dTDP-4-dehydrorhamnose reductase